MRLETTRQTTVRKSDLVAIEQGAWAYKNGMAEIDCPYTLSQLGQRCSWLAGYRDTARGLQ